MEVFPDFALSGATHDWPGLNAMLARAGDFDVVLAEALDRISRDQEDVAAIWKRVEFAGARLITVSEGPIGELQIGFTGTMSAVFLKNLGDKTRRGQVGRVAAGRIPGVLLRLRDRRAGASRGRGRAGRTEDRAGAGGGGPPGLRVAPQRPPRELDRQKAER